MFIYKEDYIPGKTGRIYKFEKNIIAKELNAITDVDGSEPSAIFTGIYRKTRSKSDITITDDGLEIVNQPAIGVLSFISPITNTEDITLKIDTKVIPIPANTLYENMVYYVDIPNEKIIVASTPNTIHELGIDNIELSKGIKTVNSDTLFSILYPHITVMSLPGSNEKIVLKTPRPGDASDVIIHMFIKDAVLGIAKVSLHYNDDSNTNSVMISKTNILGYQVYINNNNSTIEFIFTKENGSDFQDVDFIIESVSYSGTAETRLDDSWSIEAYTGDLAGLTATITNTKVNDATNILGYDTRKIFGYIADNAVYTSSNADGVNTDDDVTSFYRKYIYNDGSSPIAFNYVENNKVDIYLNNSYLTSLEVKLSDINLSELYGQDNLPNNLQTIHDNCVNLQNSADDTAVVYSGLATYPGSSDSQFINKAPEGDSDAIIKGYANATLLSKDVVVDADSFEDMDNDILFQLHKPLKSGETLATSSYPYIKIVNSNDAPVSNGTFYITILQQGSTRYFFAVGLPTNSTDASRTIALPEKSLIYSGYYDSNANKYIWKKLGRHNYKVSYDIYKAFENDVIKFGLNYFKLVRTSANNLIPMKQTRRSLYDVDMFIPSNKYYIYVFTKDECRYAHHSVMDPITNEDGNGNVISDIYNIRKGNRYTTVNKGLLILTTDNKLYCYPQEDNASGCGQCVKLQVNDSGLSDVIDFGSGLDFTFALLSDGSMKFTGNNVGNVSGIDSDTSSYADWTDTNDKCAEIFAGKSEILFRKANGGWHGRGSASLFKNSTSADSDGYTDVYAFSNLGNKGIKKFVTAFEDYGAVLTDTNEVYVIGSVSSGNLPGLTVSSVTDFTKLDLNFKPCDIAITEKAMVILDINGNVYTAHGDVTVYKETYPGSSVDVFGRVKCDKYITELVSRNGMCLARTTENEWLRFATTLVPGYSGWYTAGVSHNVFGFINVLPIPFKKMLK